MSGLSRAADHGPGRPWATLAADGFVRAALVLVALALAQLPVLSGFRGDVQSDLSRVNEIALLALAIAAQHRRRAVAHREERWHGRLLGGGLGFWLSAHALYFAAGGWEDPWVSATGDLLYVLFYFAVIAVALGRPHLGSGWSAGEHGYRFGLASGAIVLLFFFAYFVLLPTILDSGIAVSLEISYQLFVVLDLILLGRFAVLAVGTESRRWRWLYALLTLGWLGWTVGDATELLRYALAGFEISEGMSLVIQAVAFAAIVVEARLREAWPGAAAGAAQRPRGPAAAERSAWREVAPLLAIVFLLPAVHFALHRGVAFDAALRETREALLVGFVLILGALASIYQAMLARRGSKLAAELDRVADELERARRMEAVGRVAGWAAHGFNNVLTTIQGNAEMLAERLDEVDVERPEIEEIERATRQAASLAEQLLAVSRRQILSRDVVDLNAMLRRLAEEPPEGARVALELDEGLAPVLADAKQLERAVRALIDNAAEAMSNGGVVTIRSGLVAAEGEGDGPKARARFAQVEVCDTGPGIDPAIRESLFEPFVSTKRDEVSAGLGLATVYGFVRQSGGTIDVAGGRGEGTTMRMTLPLGETAAAPASAEPRPSAPPAGRAETILVVEDERPLRALVERSLRSAGYRVLAAGDAGEASELSAAHAGEIALLLSDVVLPGLDGRRLAERLAAEQPGLRVLLVSGYPQDALGPSGSLPPGFGFLQKPFTLELLRRSVERALADPAPEDPAVNPL